MTPEQIEAAEARAVEAIDFIADVLRRGGFVPGSTTTKLLAEDVGALASEVKQLRPCVDGVARIQAWIHSGDRAKDKDLQVSQLGRDVCEWLTEYTDTLRAENKRLQSEVLHFNIAICAAGGAVCARCGDKEGTPPMYHDGEWVHSAYRTSSGTDIPCEPCGAGHLWGILAGG